MNKFDDVESIERDIKNTRQLVVNFFTKGDMWSFDVDGEWKDQLAIG
jgi:hypothetical protein